MNDLAVKIIFIEAIGIQMKRALNLRLTYFGPIE